MAISQAELDSFHRFATDQLNSSDESLTLEVCLQLWREKREYVETVRDVRSGLADVAAGRVHSLAEFDADMRSMLGMVHPKFGRIDSGSDQDTGRLWFIPEGS